MLLTTMRLLAWALIGGCYHRYGRWGEPFVDGCDKLQEQRCCKCGAIEQRWVGYAGDDEAASKE